MNKKPETKFLRSQLANNLRNCRDNAKLTRDEVVGLAKTGFARSSLQAWEEGEREPKLENIYELASIYGISPSQILFGESGLDYGQLYATNDSDYKDVLIYDLAASAGTGRLVADENIKRRLKFPNWWFNERGLQHTDVVGLYTKGDSMEPTIPDNSLLLIDQSQTYLSDGKVYVVRVDDELYVKRIKRLPLVGGVQLISDNKDYAPIDLTKQLLSQENFFQVIGQVVHIGIDLPH